MKNTFLRFIPYDYFFLLCLIQVDLKLPDVSHTDLIVILTFIYTNRLPTPTPLQSLINICKGRSHNICYRKCDQIVLIIYILKMCCCLRIKFAHDYHLTSFLSGGNTHNMQKQNEDKQAHWIAKVKV